VQINHLWLLTPNLAGVLEIADEFLFLGIQTEPGLSRRLMVGSLRKNVLKLAISVRMGWAFFFFGIEAQALVVLLEQSANHRQTDPVALLLKLHLNISQTAVEPLTATHRITSRMR